MLEALGRVEPAELGGLAGQRRGEHDVVRRVQLLGEPAGPAQPGGRAGQAAQVAAAVAVEPEGEAVELARRPTSGRAPCVRCAVMTEAREHQ